MAPGLAEGGAQQTALDLVSSDGIQLLSHSLHGVLVVLEARQLEWHQTGCSEGTYGELDDGPWLGSGAGDFGIALSVAAEVVLDLDDEVEVAERGWETG